MHEGARGGSVLWLDCQAGIAGDMLVAALIDAAEDSEAAERAVRDMLGSLPFGGFSVRVRRVAKSGISCMDFDVELDEVHENHDHDMEYLHGSRDHASHDHDHDHEHDHGRGHGHRGPAEVAAIIDGARMTDRARRIARRAFDILARAEAEAHGVPLEQVHFHEVGAIDSIVDVLSAAVLVDRLDIRGAVVPVLMEGGGTIRCQHGVIPVPVPATLNICRAHRLPLGSCDVEGELVTPTGAALVAALDPAFELPARYAVRRVGLGAGKRSYSRPSIVRAVLIDPLDGEAAPLPEEVTAPADMVLLACDIDDATAEQLGYAAERLTAAGAREVHWVPIYAKKGRPAYQLQVLCLPREVPAMEEIIFLETPTLGIRRTAVSRTVLARERVTVYTPYGPVAVKRAFLPDGTVRDKPEYEDCAKLARMHGIPLQVVARAAWSAAAQEVAPRPGTIAPDGSDAVSHM